MDADVESPSETPSGPSRHPLAPFPRTFPNPRILPPLISYDIRFRISCFLFGWYLTFELPSSNHLFVFCFHYFPLSVLSAFSFQVYDSISLSPHRRRRDRLHRFRYHLPIT